MTLLPISPNNFHIHNSRSKPFCDLQQKLITEYEKTIPILEKVDSAIRALQVLRTLIRISYPDINYIQPKLYFNNRECRFSDDAQIILQLTPNLANTPFLIANENDPTFLPLMHYNTLILGSRIKVLIDKKISYSKHVQKLDVEIKNVIASLEESCALPLSVEQILSTLMQHFLFSISLTPQLDYGEKFDALSNKLKTLFEVSSPLLGRLSTDFTSDLVNLHFILKP